MHSQTLSELNVRMFLDIFELDVRRLAAACRFQHVFVLLMFTVPVASVARCRLGASW